MQYLDLKTYLVGDINTKVDRASMAHSLEVREPLMDHPLVEWLATLPRDLKVQGTEGKVLLKKAMEPHLPHDIMYRPKMGFSVPLAQWFRGPLRQRVRDSVLGETLAATGIFERRVLEQSLRRPPARRARPQFAALDAADVRVVPAQREGDSCTASATRHDATFPASCTCWTTRCRCTAGTRFARSRSCASSGGAAGRHCT